MGGIRPGAGAKMLGVWMFLPLQVKRDQDKVEEDKGSAAPQDYSQPVATSIGEVE